MCEARIVPGQILVCFHITHGNRVNAVAVGRRMHGADGARIPVVGHPCDLAKMCFVESGVGHDDCQRGVAGKLVVDCLDGGRHLVQGASETFMIRRKKSCDPKETSANRRCIRFANKGTDIWDAELGANLIARTTVR